MLDTRQIHPLTDFLRNHKAHLARLKETRIPEILTVNGRAEIVVQDAESYQELLDRLYQLETIVAFREGIASAERGELKPTEQVFAEMQAKTVAALGEVRAAGVDPAIVPDFDLSPERVPDSSVRTFYSRDAASWPQSS